MMVRARFGIGMDGDCTRPEFFSTYARKVDGCLSVHAGRGGYIAVQLIARNNPHTLVFPFGRAMFRVVVIMIVLMVVVCAHWENYLLFNYWLVNYRLSNR
jgi:hypothetical protein